MCLTVTEKKTLVSEVDLTFYKVVYRTPKYMKPWGETVYSIRSIFRGFHIDLGVTYVCPTSGFEYEAERKSAQGDLWSVERGGFHLFCNYGDASDFARRFSAKDDVMEVIRAIIPKGTEYIEGLFAVDAYNYKYVPSVCTKKVRYEEL